jgi:alkaline phosphatase D
MKFAFVSCQSWHAGFYTAYRHLANEDVDLVLHLGDYIYEFATDPVGGPRNTPIPASAQVPTESLDQYRQRYALYKTDPDLQAAHAAAPFVVTWDDHEIVNNYAGEAANDAAFLVRQANAYRAYWEHMPLRPLHQPAGKDMQLYRRLRFGDLLELNVLDTRQYRSAQVTGNARFDEARTILGAQQEQWLLGGLTAHWNVLAQQVLMGQLDSDPGSATSVGNDSWDGYAANRIRVVDAIEARKVSNPVVLCGDVHRHQASHVKGDYRVADAKIVAPEFTCTSISSAGDGSLDTPNAGNLYAANPHLRMTTSQRGYAVATVTRDEWRTDFRTVPYITRPNAPVSTHASYVVESGNPEMEAA